MSICRICGNDGEGMLFDEWVRPTFTDHDKLQAGDIICDKCLFWFDERSEELARRVGKEKPQRMRNYSHFVVDGEWIPLSKADKARMAELLLGEPPPELAIVAVSGQKHLAFRARPGWWQIEEQSVQPFPELLARLLEQVEALYAVFSKSEIGSGNYAGHRILKFGLAEWRELETQIAPWRGTVQLELALFLAQKKETESDGIAREIERDAGDHLARRTGRVQEPLPHDDMDAVRGPYQERGLHQQPEQVHQLSMFET